MATNPYSSDLPDEDPHTSPAEPSGNPWKEIARRWERLRLTYNLLIAAVGLLFVVINSAFHHPAIVVPIFGYAVAANICYLLGPITEMYYFWANDGLRRISDPKSPTITRVLFVLGTGFSLILTLMMGVASMLVPF